MNNSLLQKIEDIAAEPGIAPEALMLLRMAAEAQKTGRMPDLPIALQPMPVSLPQSMPYSGDYTGHAPLGYEATGFSDDCEPSTRN